MVFGRLNMGHDNEKKKEKEKQNGFFKEILIEIRDTIVFEVVWNILMLIPRMMIRVIKNIW